MKVNNYRLNQLIDQGIVKEVLPLSKHPKYIPNKIYWCGYWHKYYTVIAVKYGEYKRLKEVTVKWEDGKEGTHCTLLDSKRDFELILSR